MPELVTRLVARRLRSRFGFVGGPGRSHHAFQALVWALAVVLAVSLLETWVPRPAAAVPRAAEVVPAAPQVPAGPLERDDESSARALAASSGQRVEVLGLRTETTQVFAEASGAMSMSSHARPVRVRRPDGSWVPVDTDLVVTDGGGVAPKATSAGLRFSGGGTGPFATVAAGGKSVGLSWPTPLPSPALSGSTATYADVLPGVDLKVTADVDGFSQVLVVKTRVAGLQALLAQLVMPVTATGVTAGLDPDGNLTGTDPGGAVVFASGAPLMWDSSTAGGGGEPGRRSPVGVSLAGGVLSLVPDAAMLSDPATQYPVYIDPSPRLSKLAWTMYDSGTPTASYYNSADVAKVGTYNAGTNKLRSSFYFATDTLRGKHIMSATFNAHLGYSQSCTPKVVELWKTTAFSSSSTWNTMPTFSTKINSWNGAAGFSSACPAETVRFSITPTVQADADANQTRLWIAFKALSETDTLGWKKFSNNPNLDVTWEEPTPGAPTAVVASPASGSALVSWSPPAIDGRSAIAGYTVTASPGGATASTTGATSVTVSGLTDGTAYTFTVVAANAEGPGPASVASAPCTPRTVPGGPTGVAATAGNASAAVTWAAPGNTGGAPVTGYTVTASPGGATASTAGATSTTVAGLSNGTAYTFTVRARNEAGTGVASAPSSAVTPRTVPGAPTAVAATPGDGSLAVTWTPPGDGGSPVTGYTVTASPGGATVTAEASATSTTVTGLTNGTAYTVTVTAANAAGPGATSSPSGPVTPRTVPGAPTGLAATAPRHSSADLTWTAPSSTGGAPITGYQITVTPGGRIVSTPGTVTGSTVTATVDDLTNGTAYTFAVTALNAAGAGAASAASNPATPRDTTPGAATGVAVSDTTDTTATVTWVPPQNDGGTALTGYVITAQPGGEFARVDAPATQTTVAGLPAGTHRFVVTTRNANGPGPTSTPSGPTTLTGPGFAPPSAVTVTPHPTAPHLATVSWTASPAVGVTGYEIYVSPRVTFSDDAGSPDYTTTGPTQVDAGPLRSGQTYVFSVRAVRGSGTSGYARSSPYVTAMAAPSLYGPPSPTPGDGSITVDFKSSYGTQEAVITAFPGGATRTVAGNAVRATLGGLQNGTAYRVEVTVKNSAGQSTQVAPYDVTPQAAPLEQILPISPHNCQRDNAVDVGPNGRYLAWSTNYDAGQYYQSDSCTAVNLADSQEQVTYNLVKGGPSNWLPEGASMSDDGRLVVFSTSVALVAGDTNNQKDVYLVDRAAADPAQALRIVSTGSDGALGNGPSSAARISGSGRYIAFATFATNFIEGDVNGGGDVVRKDLTTGAVELVSTDSDDRQVDIGHALYIDPGDVSLSRDGNEVVFTVMPYPGTGVSYASMMRHMATGTRRNFPMGLAAVSAKGGTYFGNSYCSVADGMFLTPKERYDDNIPKYGCAWIADASSPEPKVYANVEVTAVSPDGSIATLRLPHQEPARDAVVLNRKSGRTSLLAPEYDARAIAISDISDDNMTMGGFRYNPNVGSYEYRSVMLKYQPEGSARGRVWSAGWRQSVNTASGALSFAATDTQVQSVGADLNVARTYNSTDTGAGAFGRGFSSYLDTRLDTTQGGVTVRRGDGRIDLFRGQGGSYTAPSGMPATLGAVPGGGWRLTDNNHSTMRFDAAGRLVAMADPQGHEVVLGYSGGRVVSATDTVSRRGLTFVWSGPRVVEARTSAVAAHGGALVWRYTYDGEALTTVCGPPAGATPRCTTYLYDPLRFDLLSTVRDATGAATMTVTYGLDHRVDTSQVGAEGPQDFDYVEPGRTEITDGRGNLSVHTFDDAGRLIEEVDPDLGTKKHRYDANGLPIETTDENNNTTRATFSSRGDKKTDVDAEGRTAYLGYDAEGRLTGVADRRAADDTDPSVRTAYAWDASHNLLSVTTPPLPGHPSGTTRTWTYTTGTEPAVGGGGSMPAKLPRTATAAGGGQTRYAYDTRGDLRTVTTALGARVEMTYDELGRLLTRTEHSQAVPDGARTTYTYDEFGRVLTERGPPTVEEVSGVAHQRLTTNTYDPAGRLRSVRVSDAVTGPGSDPARTTHYTYDTAGRVLTASHPTADPTGTDPPTPAVAETRGYDDNGNLATVRDALGRTDTTTYNARSLPTTVTRTFTDGTTPPLVTATYGYDPAGRRVEQTDALGRTARITYDKANRPTRVVLVGYVEADGTTRDMEVSATRYDHAGNPVEQWSGGPVGVPGALRRHETASYDAAGRVTQTRLEQPAADGGDRVTSYGYDADGNQAEVTRTSSTAPGQEQVRRVFDAAGNPLSETVENGDVDLTTTYRHDDRGLLTAVTDPRGAAAAPTGQPDPDYTTLLGYDTLGRQVRTTGPQVDVDTASGVSSGRAVETVGYDTFGNPRHRRDARGAQTTTTYDLRGQAVRVDHPAYTRPDGQTLHPVSTASYDDGGRVYHVVDRRGGVHTADHDGLDRVVRRTEPALPGDGPPVPPTWSATFDPAGQLTSSTDPRGARTEYTYDQAGRVRTTTAVLRRPGQADQRLTTTTGYDDLGNLIERRDPAGGTTRAAWSPAGELLRATDAAEKTTTYGYDLAGRRTSQVDPLGRSTRWAYDQAGRATGTTTSDRTGAQLTTTAAGYDPAGNRTSATTARGNTTVSRYDAGNRLLFLTRPTGTSTWSTTTFGYDLADQVTRSTDGRGHDTTQAGTRRADAARYDVRYTYTPEGHTESTVEPPTPGQTAAGDRTWTTSYDTGGLPVAETRPGGITVARTFDPRGKLRTETGASTDPGTPGATRTFGYDTAGNLTTVGHPDGQQTLTWDDLGRLTGSTGPAGASSYTYDPAGRPLTITDAAGTRALTWDPRGLLTGSTEPLTGVRLAHGYDDAGQLTSTTYSTAPAGTPAPAGSAVRTYGYDDLGRLTDDRLVTGTTQTQVTRTGYGYDPDGNLTTRTVTAPGNPAAGTRAYTYDRAGRLASTTAPGAAAAGYGWDDADNRTTAGADTYTYDDRNRLTARTGAGGPTATYQWSPRGTLTRATPAPGSPGPQVDYTFDALDRLTGVDRGPSTSGAVTAAYSYDALDRLAARTTTGATAASTGYTYAGTDIDPVTDGARRYSRGPAGDLLAASDGTAVGARLTVSNTHGDLTATLTAATATGGAVGLTAAGTSVYQPFGAVAGTGGTGTTDAGRLGFQGDLTDPVGGSGDGLVWMGARWYDPALGAFASRDTMARHTNSRQLLNRYSYADANPVTLADPDGHCTTTGWGCTFDTGPTSHTVHVALAAWSDSSVAYQLPPPPPRPSPQPATGDGLADVNDPDPDVAYVARLTAAKESVGHAYGGISERLDAAYNRLKEDLHNPAQARRDIGQLASAWKATAEQTGKQAVQHVVNGATYVRNNPKQALSTASKLAADTIGITDAIACAKGLSGGGGSTGSTALACGLTALNIAAIALPALAPLAKGLKAASVAAKTSSATLKTRTATKLQDTTAALRARLPARGDDTGAFHPGAFGPANRTPSANAAETGGGGTTSIFRAVSGREAGDIAANGFRQAPDGRSLEAKLFATSAEDAARFGRINYGQDRIPFHIVEARVPSSFVDDLYRGHADRMPFLGVHPDQLAGLNRVSDVQIWNSVPWVAKP